MSSTLVRLMLSVVFILSLPVMYTIVFIVTTEMNGVGDDEALWAATVVTGGFMVCGWVVIWVRQVRWAPWRIVLTLIAAPAAGIPAALVGLVMVAVIDWFDEFAVLSGGMVWAIAYLAGTVLVWRETAGERAQRLHRLGIGAIACPGCGYNLTGLREATCPECGARYTLDQLFAAAAEEQRDVEV